MSKHMRAVEAVDFSIGSLRLCDRPVPTVRDGEVLIRIEAASLNYRDLAILDQKFMPHLKLPYVPCSDCSGEVVSIGDGVTRFKEGVELFRCTPRVGTAESQRNNNERRRPLVLLYQVYYKSTLLFRSKRQSWRLSR